MKSNNPNEMIYDNKEDLVSSKTKEKKKLRIEGLCLAEIRNR